MESTALTPLIRKGESSKVRFKERLPHPDSIAPEFAAFANTEGSPLIVGVNDKTGALNRLSFAEIQSARELPLHMNIRANRSPGFRHLVSGLQKLIAV